MPIKKKQSKNLWELERERLSNFVIDLREKTVEDPGETEKEPNIIERNIVSLRNKMKDIKPNLLKKDLIFWKRRIVWPKINVSKLKTVHKKNSFWQKIINEKQKVLNQPVRVKAAKKRMIRAEEKVAWYRSILSLAVILVLIIIPIKILSYFEFLDLHNLESTILNKSQSAMNNLMAAGESINNMDFGAADVQFQNASTNFVAAQNELDQINDSLLMLAAISNDPKIKLAAESKKFLEVGAIASSLGQNLIKASDSLFNSQPGKFSEALNSFAYFGNLAVADANKLTQGLDDVNVNNLPPEYREQFIDLKDKTEILAGSLENFVNMGIKLKEVLGLSRDKRYLLVFQNNAELRASGGFLGSYALVDIRDGKIRNLEVPGGGSYDMEAGMSVLVKAPEPLWLVNPLWHFWDANWWPDWPTTAKNLMWFYEKSNGPTVDGVISITPTVVERLLEITGPIDLTEEYGLVIDSDNFWETVQKVVEDKNLAKFKPEAVLDFNKDSAPIESDIPLEQGLEVNSENKPKKIIGDLMAKILEVLPQRLDKDNLIKIISLFEQNMSEKQILFYFTDPKLQAEISNHNWAGEIRNPKHDYLMVVNTNIAGQKSDRKVKEDIKHESQVLPNGEIINTVTITRTHEAENRAPLVGVRNVDWLRVYVPRGSQLIKATGFSAPSPEYLTDRPDERWEDNPQLRNEMAALVHADSGTKIYEENKKTVFANWVMVDPGESVKIVLTYKLPFNFYDQEQKDTWLARINELLNPNKLDLLPYSLLVQKQPGTLPSTFSSHLDFPSNLNVFWHYPDDLRVQNGWEIDDKLNSDKHWSILVNQK